MCEQINLLSLQTFLAIESVAKLIRDLDSKQVIQILKSTRFHNYRPRTLPKLTQGSQVKFNADKNYLL